MDLRKYLEQVQDQLQTVQLACVQDMMTSQQQISQLCSQIRASNNIISRLEDLLSKFQIDLANISSDITSLKEQSLYMSVALNNRKQLQEKLNTFLKQVTLSSQLIQDICFKQINEDYLQYINELRVKLLYFRTQGHIIYQGGQVTAISMQEVLPELRKLNAKASQRIRLFLISHIQALTKPKTNIQLMQEGTLIKFKDFLIFLRENSQQMFVEICMSYTETLIQIFHHHFKAYLLSLKKVIRDECNKNDVIVSQTMDIKASYVPGFDLKNRHQIISQLEQIDPIISHTAKKNNQKFYLQQIFHSVIRLLADTASFNFLFVLDFFNIKADQFGPVFGEIFTKTFQYLLEGFSQLFSSTFDVLALLLILKINQNFQEIMEKRHIPIMNNFFQRIRMIVWPRLQSLLDRNISFMQSAAYLRATDILVHTLTYRFSQFVIALHKIASVDDMFRQRLYLLKKSYVGLLERLSNDIRDEKNRHVFLINNFEYLMEEFHREEFSPSPQFVDIETEIQNLTENFINLQLREAFGGLMQLLEDPQQAQMEHLEMLLHDFNANWKKSLNLIQTIEKDLFPNQNGQKEMLRRTYTVFLMKFNDFSDFVKKKYSSLARHLLPVNAIMTEIQKQLSFLEVVRNFISNKFDL